MQKHNLHIIQPYETIDDIAKLYQLDKHDLIYFHNNHCLPRDTILIDITNQKELYIPRFAVSDREKKVNFRNHSLIFEPKGFNQSYGVRIIFEKQNNETELKYETSVKWIKTEDKLHYFEIDRISNLFIDEEEVNNIADLLACKSSQVLYPLTISIDKYGKFNAVENLSSYQNRWDNIKTEIYKEFDGEVVENYFKQIEKVIVDEPSLLNLYLKNDYFIRTLFFGIYQNYGKHYQINGNETFPIIENINEPNYQIKLEIDPIIDEYDMIWIDGNGKLNEERTPEDFFNNSPFADDDNIINQNGKIRVRYYLNNQTKWIESAFLECSILTNNLKKVSISISKLE
ncbi:hypothetical protein ACTS94_02695 [Empedobacter falsenii]